MDVNKSISPPAVDEEVTLSAAIEMESSVPAQEVAAEELVDCNVGNDSDGSPTKRRKIESEDVDNNVETVTADVNGEKKVECDSVDNDKNDKIEESKKENASPKNKGLTFRQAHKPNAFWGGNGQPPAHLNNFANMSYEEYEKAWADAAMSRYRELVQEQKDAVKASAAADANSNIGAGMMPGMSGMGMMGPGGFGMPGQMGGMPGMPGMGMPLMGPGGFGMGGMPGMPGMGMPLMGPGGFGMPAQMGASSGGAGSNIQTNKQAAGGMAAAPSPYGPG